MDQGMNTFPNAQQQQQQQQQFKGANGMAGPPMTGRVPSAKEQTLMWQQGNWDSGIQSGRTTNAPSISSRASGLEMDADDDIADNDTDDAYNGWRPRMASSQNLWQIDRKM